MVGGERAAVAGTGLVSLPRFRESIRSWKPSATNYSTTALRHCIQQRTPDPPDVDVHFRGLLGMLVSSLKRQEEFRGFIFCQFPTWELTRIPILHQNPIFFKWFRLETEINDFTNSQLNYKDYFRCSLAINSHFEICLVGHSLVEFVLNQWNYSES